MSDTVGSVSAERLDRKKKKILFAMIEAGGGHKSPALAVNEAMQRLYPGLYDLMLLDFMKGTGAVRLDEKHKQSWEFLLEHPILCRSGELITEVTGPVFRFGLKYYLTPFYSYAHDFLLEHKPDLVFSTHPFNTMALDQVRKKFNLSFVLVNYLTELFDASAFWILKDVDFFLVHNAEVKSRLIKKGIAEEKLRVFDFPIRSPFFYIRDADPRQIAVRFGLDSGKKTLLMSMGGQGSGNFDRFIDMLLEENLPLNVLACTGKNEEQRARLAKAYEGGKSPVTVKVFGYTERMHELMMASDFCFIKPGPNTAVEAMVLRKPMLFTRYVHQGEKSNIQFAEEHGIGFATGDSPALFLEKIKLLMDDRNLKEIKSHYDGIVIKNGAEDIARFITTLVDGSL
jgi:processive 1,2-diacylglycerol beta-glucosyltransferase